MSGKRNVSVCRGHELANALYVYHFSLTILVIISIIKLLKTRDWYEADSEEKISIYKKLSLQKTKNSLFQTIQFSINTQFNCQKHFYFKLFRSPHMHVVLQHLPLPLVTPSFVCSFVFLFSPVSLDRILV